MLLAMLFYGIQKKRTIILIKFQNPHGGMGVCRSDLKHWFGYSGEFLLFEVTLNGFIEVLNSLHVTILNGVNDAGVHMILQNGKAGAVQG